MTLAGTKVETARLIRGRAHVRGRLLAGDAETRDEGVVPAPALARLRMKVETAVPARPDAGAVPLIIRVVVVASGPVIAGPVVPVVSAPEAPLNVAEGAARVVGPATIEARLKTPTVPSEAVQVILQVLLTT